jgi:pantoate--beta-alanine ligase
MGEAVWQRSAQFPCISSKGKLRETVRGWRREEQTIGVVMTMGVLHRGHLSLVEEAARLCDKVIVTIYVNPLQFGPNEDYANYPRDLIGDLRRLEEVHCDLVFAPSDDEMFPDGLAGFQTCIRVEGISDGLCGAHRPGHFDGVATEVTKQLLITEPDFAFFGEKDFQQLRVIEQLVADLSIPVEVVGLPVAREGDGLAFSSRNIYLDSQQRERAPALYRCLVKTAAAVLAVADADVGAALLGARRFLHEQGFEEIDYLKLVDAKTLVELERAPQQEARLMVAAWLGSARLIDNVPVVPGAEEQ